MTSDLQTARDLRLTASYLRTFGWRQGALGYDGAERCVVGAFLSGPCWVTSQDAWATTEQIRHLANAMGFSWAANDLDREGISVWNDHGATTLDEVLDRLESTALALEIRALSRETQAPLEEVVTPELAVR